MCISPFRQSSVRDRDLYLSLLFPPPRTPLLSAHLFIPLRLHSLDKVAKRLSEILCLLSSQTLDQLVGDIGRALHLRQEIITEEINRFLTSRLQGVSEKHGNFEQDLNVSMRYRGTGKDVPSNKDYY